jgi:hypothetical protein
MSAPAVSGVGKVAGDRDPARIAASPVALVNPVLARTAGRRAAMAKQQMVPGIAVHRIDGQCLVKTIVIVAKHRRKQRTTWLLVYQSVFYLIPMSSRTSSPR